jgi:hypothetical protein
MELVERLVNANKRATSVTAQRARERCNLNKTPTPLETAPDGPQTMPFGDSGPEYLLKRAVRNLPTQL